jgi:hypothetical protein
VNPRGYERRVKTPGDRDTFITHRPQNGRDPGTECVVQNMQGPELTADAQNITRPYKMVRKTLDPDKQLLHRCRRTTVKRHLSRRFGVPAAIRELGVGVERRMRKVDRGFREGKKRRRTSMGETGMNRFIPSIQCMLTWSVGCKKPVCVPCSGRRCSSRVYSGGGVISGR